MQQRRNWTQDECRALHRRYVDTDDTLEVISQDYGITRERIRQLIEKVDPDAAQTRYQKKLERFITFAEENPRMTSDELAAATGVSYSYVVRHLPPGNPRERWSARRSETPYPQAHIELEDALGHIREVARSLGKPDGPISKEMYNTHRREDHVCAEFFYAHLGRWNHAVRAAGLTHVHQLRDLSTYSEQFTDDQLWTWLMVWLQPIDARGETATYIKFENWTKSMREYGCPSAAVVRLRLGRQTNMPWVEMKRLARQKITESQEKTE